MPSKSMPIPRRVLAPTDLVTMQAKVSLEQVTRLKIHARMEGMSRSEMLAELIDKNTPPLPWTDAEEV